VLSLDSDRITLYIETGWSANDLDTTLGDTYCLEKEVFLFSPAEFIAY